ncbi:kinase [Hirsutella rhossiliensis]|uniref:Kinase n=1 Tax=Hirsutella rhossiliensis TaxID=111463 RepID=A0A9P8N1D8_9HYPO|nr:kinase [Hirsutella rhossiliensis]KAH0966398.1 kinase [Hirsutella rhossiliensis]
MHRVLATQTATNPSHKLHQSRPREESRDSSHHGGGGGSSGSSSSSSSNEGGSWTGEDEARSTVLNRGLAMDKYIRGSCLGNGGWSWVYKVLRVADGRVLAGKASEAVAKMRKESDILQSLKHPHILKFIDWHGEPGNAAATLLITELCRHGTLQTRIDHASPSMDRGEILLAVRQVGDALAYLHSRRLFHTDVKARNILVRGLSPLDVVLADCGDVRRVQEAQHQHQHQHQHQQRRRRRGGRSANDTPLGGTPSYYSPEMVRRNRHVGPGDDVWALGVTLLGMVAQWPVLRRHDKEELRAYPGRCAAHARTLLALNPRHDLVLLLARMLEGDEGARAAARECADVAGRLLLLEREREADGELGIESPADFRPISFW